MFDFKYSYKQFNLCKKRARIFHRKYLVKRDVFWENMSRDYTKLANAWSEFAKEYNWYFIEE